MPEEKKESFTFSDKIKNSKPAGSKSFAKPSSKIGRDGKPKQTLFERTRRDAPFFIAALVALLLLPFLYKYSGQSSEDTALLTPGSEESMFDPERYGFDTAMNVDDPDNQIAQLSGRSSLDLIKGWGNKEEEDYGRDDMDFDASASGAYDAEGEYSANRSSSTNIDEEENITNIYKRRARQGTRAAFRRTQIGKLDPASMRRPGGSRLGIGNWGGSIKEAAKRVGPSGPRSAPKPVSLQPLRAAGPARSSFGGGAGVAARKGLDNMGKANAIEALRDSYVKPVDPVRAGGIDLFSDGRSGGSGKLDHNIHIGKGETPWWWDMMKTRMQKEWEKRFERKWGWITWADDIAKNILKGLINCLVTGDSDGDPDNFLGDINIGGSSGKDPTCCGWSAKKLDPEKLAKVNGDVKRYCDSKVWKAELKAAGADCSRGYKGGGSSGGASVGFFGQRLSCLGINVGGAYTSGDLGLNSASGLDCENMPTYNVIPSGQARKWNIYTYVVVRNYAPQALVQAGKITARNTKNGNQYLLCGSNDRQHGGTSLEHNNSTAGVGDVSAKNEGAVENVIVTNKESSHVTTEQQQIRERYLEYDQESLRDSCVIVVSRGNVLPYEQVKNQIMDLFMQKYNVDNETAAKAFFQLDLMYVESFATKHKLAYAQWFETGHKLVKLLPMPYWEFENAYINHRKVTHKLDGSKDKVYKAKWRVDNVDMVKGPRCFYGLQIDCGPDSSAQAFVKFDNTSFKGGNTDEKPNPKDVHVSAEFRYLNNGQEGAKHSVVQPMTNIPGVSKDGYTFTYTFSNIIDSDKVTKTSEIIHPADGKWDLVGNIVWTVERGAEVVTKDCPLNLSGNGPTPPVEEKQCENAQESEKCCLEINGDGYMWDASKPAGSRCVKKQKDECPQGKDTNAKCCKDIMGPGYLFDENHDPKCYKQNTPSSAQTRLAQVISWVPTNGKTSCREDAGNEQNPTEGTFTKCPKIPGVVKGNDQKCGSQRPMMMDSEAAAKFVKDVVKAFNAQRSAGEKLLSDKFSNGKYPTDGEFIDALYLAKGLGIQTVSASAVCELGRDMVRMSRDKHTKEKRVAKPLSTPYGSEQWKDSNTVFHNELGAFLAYIHLESLFYPQKYYGSMEQCDYRFQVTGEGCPSMVNWANEKCLYGGKEKCKEYHHNNYNNIPKAGAQAASTYSRSLAPIQGKGAYPLHGLAFGSFPQVGNSDGARKGKQYIERISPLLREGSGFTAWQGQACVAAAGSSTVQVEDVLKYVETACSVGLDFKPYGTPGSRTSTQSSSGHPGSDTGTQAN